MNARSLQGGLRFTVMGCVVAPGLCVALWLCGSPCPVAAADFDFHAPAAPAYHAPLPQVYQPQEEQYHAPAPAYHPQEPAYHPEQPAYHPAEPQFHPQAPQFHPAEAPRPEAPRPGQPPQHHQQ